MSEQPAKITLTDRVTLAKQFQSIANALKRPGGMWQLKYDSLFREMTHIKGADLDKELAGIGRKRLQAKLKLRESQAEARAVCVAPFFLPQNSCTLVIPRRGQVLNPSIWIDSRGRRVHVAYSYNHGPAENEIFEFHYSADCGKAWLKNKKGITLSHSNAFLIPPTPTSLLHLCALAVARNWPNMTPGSQKNVMKLMARMGCAELHPHYLPKTPKQQALKRKLDFLDIDLAEAGNENAMAVPEPPLKRQRLDVIELDSSLDDFMVVVEF